MDHAHFLKVFSITFLLFTGLLLAISEYRAQPAPATVLPERCERPAVVDSLLVRPPRQQPKRAIRSLGPRQKINQPPSARPRPVEADTTTDPFKLLWKKKKIERFS
jgi:hypothetical protein